MKFQLSILLGYCFLLSSGIASAEIRSPCETITPCYLERYQNHEIEPVTNEELSLIGRGVKGRKSGQVVVAACVGKAQSCDTIRFAYYPTAVQGYWIGPFFQLKDLTDKKGNKITATDALKKSLKRYMKSNFDGNDVVGSALTGSLWLGGIITGLAGAPIILVGALIAAGLTGAMIGTRGTLEVFDPTRAFNQGFVHSAGKEMTNTQGWNWSADPARSREKPIRNFVTDLSGGSFSLNENFSKYFVQSSIPLTN